MRLNGCKDEHVTTKIFLLEKNAETQNQDIEKIKEQVLQIHLQMNTIQHSISTIIDLTAKVENHINDLQSEIKNSEQWRFKMMGANGVLVFIASILATFLLGFFQ